MAHPFEAYDHNPEQAVSAKLSGNRCGHDPASPRLLLTDNPYKQDDWKADQLDSMGSHRKNSFFYTVADALNEFYFFPKTIPLLGFIYQDDKIHRQHRSEARESDAPLLSALVQHMELASINWDKGFARVGRPTKDGFLYYDTKYWMKKTGLPESRLKRSFRRLKKKGYIQRERRWVEREKGKFKGLATMTLINLSFFNDIGVLDKLREAKDYAYKALCKAAEELQVTAGKMLACPIMKIKKEAEIKRQASKKADPADYPPTAKEHWTCRLNKGQVNDFNNKYLQILIERGETGDPAQLYREVYLSIVQA